MRPGQFSAEETSNSGDCEEVAGEAMVEDSGGLGDQDRSEGKPAGSEHEDGMLQRFRQWILSYIDLLQSRISPPRIFNFLKGGYHELSDLYFLL